MVCLYLDITVMSRCCVQGKWWQCVQAPGKPWGCVLLTGLGSSLILNTATATLCHTGPHRARKPEWNAGNCSSSELTWPGWCRCKVDGAEHCAHYCCLIIRLHNLIAITRLKWQSQTTQIVQIRVTVCTGFTWTEGTFGSNIIFGVVLFSLFY